MIRSENQRQICLMMCHRRQSDRFRYFLKWVKNYRHSTKNLGRSFFLLSLTLLVSCFLFVPTLRQPSWPDQTLCSCSINQRSPSSSLLIISSTFWPLCCFSLRLLFWSLAAALIISRPLAERFDGGPEHHLSGPAEPQTETGKLLNDKLY